MEFYGWYSVPVLGTLGYCLYGSGIFCRRHSGQFLELPGKIVDRRIAKKIWNLSKVHIVFPDKLFGKIYFHTGEKFNHTALVFLSKNLLQLRMADHIVSGNFLDSQRFPDVLFQIMYDLPADIRSRLTWIVNSGRRRIVWICTAAYHMDQKFFQIQDQKLKIIIRKARKDIIKPGKNPTNQLSGLER